MNSKINDLSELVNKAEDDEQEVVHPEVAINEENDDQSNVGQNISTETEAVNINSEEISQIHNATFDKSFTDDAKTVRKKDLSDNSRDIAVYLKSEFIGLSTKDINVQQQDKVKLPKYTEIDMPEYSIKNNKKGCNRIFNKDKPNLFWKEPIVVQFMGSEKCGEDKEAIEYEPDNYNSTVRKMFLFLMLLHVVTLFLTFSLYVAAMTREIFMEYGLLISFGPFFLLLALVIFAACSKMIRSDFGVYLFSAWTVILLSIGGAAFSGFVDEGTIMYGYLAMIFMDLFIFLMGLIRRSFDYSSRALYFIALFFGILALVCIIYVEDNHYRGYAYVPYWSAGDYTTYVITTIYTIFMIVILVAELRFLLAGEWIELGEDDSFFGAYLMFVSPIDFPIRMLRKAGAFNMCDSGSGEEE